MLEWSAIPNLQTSDVLLSSPFPMPFLSSLFSEQVDASYQVQMVTSSAGFLGDLDSSVTPAKWFSILFKNQYGEMKLSFPGNSIVSIFKNLHDWLVTLQDQSWASNTDVMVSVTEQQHLQIVKSQYAAVDLNEDAATGKKLIFQDLLCNETI